MLGAADVEVDRHPVLQLRRVGRTRRRSSGRCSAGSTSTTRPTAASCWSRAGSACRRCDVHPVGRLRQRRLGRAGRLEVVQVGQDQRQLATRRRRGPGRSPSSTVQDRERLAPVALAAEQPVAQLVVDASRGPSPCSSSQAMIFAFASAVGRPSSDAGVDRDAVVARTAPSGSSSGAAGLLQPLVGRLARRGRSAGRTAWRTRSRARRGRARP